MGAVDKNLVLSGFSSVGPAYRSKRVRQIDMVDTLTAEMKRKANKIIKVDVIAPGGEVDSGAASTGGCYYRPGIISAKAAGAGDEPPCNVGTQHKKMSGTSQAAPHVAGLSALILQAARKEGPARKGLPLARIALTSLRAS